MNLPSPPTTVSHPSPPLSPSRVRSSKDGRDDGLLSEDQDVVGDYLDNLTFNGGIPNMNHNVNNGMTDNFAWDGISIAYPNTDLQYPPMDGTLNSMNIANLSLNLGSLPMTCAPSDILMSLPTPLDDGLCMGEYPYDLSLMDGNMNVNMLPSPPSTTSPSLVSSSDPPSPALPNTLPNFTGIDTSKLKLSLPTMPTAINTNTATTPTSQTKKASPQSAKEPKTKSSHTTIERRYRTNLNSRLISLRLAVPALRALDKDDVGGYEPDERGYVDGVKIAKKNSKAIVLGKAEEYILVLNRRTNRLKTELSALKSLFISLLPPGEGAALLSQWEANHKATYGDERSDELPQSIEDDDGDDDGEEEEDERPKKKVKKDKKESSTASSQSPTTATAPPPPSATVMTPGGTEVPVKRKRGRPRKNPLPVPVAASVAVADPIPAPSYTSDVVPPPQEPEFQPQMQQQVQQQQPQQQQGQYLLAAFAFFSLFGGSSNPSSYPNPSGGSGHQGQVLTPLLNNTPISTSSMARSWMGYILSPELLRIIQLLTSVLLLISLLSPYVSKIMPSATRKTEKKEKKMDALFGLLKTYMFGVKQGSENVELWVSRARQAVLEGNTSSITRVRLSYALSSFPPSGETSLLLELLSSSSSSSSSPALEKLGLTQTEALDILRSSSNPAASSSSPFVQILKDATSKKNIKNQVITSFIETVHGRPSPSFSVEEKMASNDEEIETLLQARDMFLSIFSVPSTSRTKEEEASLIMTPPPSPRSGAKAIERRKHELRVLLGSAVFEGLGQEVEEARDVVVGMLEG